MEAFFVIEGVHGAEVLGGGFDFGDEVGFF